MSLAAPSSRKPWLALVGVFALVALVAGVLLTDLPGKRLLSSGGLAGGSEGEVAEAVPQARWNITPAKTMSHATKAQSERVRRQRPRVTELVKSVYDAMFVHPDRLGATLDQSFRTEAARALRRSGAAVPASGLLRTTSRRAEIGIHSAGRPMFAIASVSLKAEPVDGSAEPLAHSSTLWMERSRNGWKIIAFQLKQGPETASKAGKSSKKPAKKKPARRK